MKHFRRIVSAAMAAVMVFGCALTANAADSYTTMLKKGEEYTIIGKGVTNDGIVMNLNDKEKVVGIYYITIPEELRLPEYTVKVEDTPNPSDAEIDVFYNETLGMYGIRIIAQNHRNAGECKNLIRAHPILHGEEHIRSHDKPQSIIWVQFGKFRQGICGIACPAATDLQITHFRTDIFRRKPCHCKTRLGIGCRFRHGLMRRDGTREQNHTIEMQCIPCSDRCVQMPGMRRIIGSA